MGSGTACVSLASRLPSGFMAALASLWLLGAVTRRRTRRASVSASFAAAVSRGTPAVSSCAHQKAGGRGWARWRRDASAGSVAQDARARADELRTPWLGRGPRHASLLPPPGTAAHALPSPTRALTRLLQLQHAHLERRVQREPLRVGEALEHGPEVVHQCHIGRHQAAGRHHHAGKDVLNLRGSEREGGDVDIGWRSERARQETVRRRHRLSDHDVRPATRAHTRHSTAT